MYISIRPLLSSRRHRLPTVGTLIESLLCIGLSLFLTLPVIADDLELLTAAAKRAMRRAAPSIVQIETLGGLEKVDGFLIGTAPTTGVVVDKRGFVISSAFNFKHAPSAILVTLPNGEKCAAEIVARDTSRMLVLLRLETQQTLSVPEAVPMEQIRTGQWAFALGKTFDVEQPSISIGIISATDRIWGRAIQTDAKTSPTNYGGPLVDLQGRVFGVIVPLSPDSSSEVAGADQYDGGIGFAIPLVDILRMLPKMEEGNDIAPGLLGVTIKNKDLYAVGPPEVAYLPPKSPAAIAGIKKGDQIVEVNGVTIRSQAAMKHALGPHNAGETIEFVIQRGAEQLSLPITLVDKIDPYVIPFLGILPQLGGDRSAEPGAGENAEAAPLGPVIAFIYNDSAAAQAGLQVADQLWKLNGKALPSADDWRYEIASMQPGDTVSISVMRKSKAQEFTVTLKAMPDSVPDDITPLIRTPDRVANKEEQDGQMPVPETGWVELKLPEEPNKCFAWIPQNYDTNQPSGLLILIGAPGKIDQQEIESRWGTFCRENHYLLLLPQSEDERGWQRSETSIIRKFFNRLAKMYSIDTNRIAAVGSDVGGVMSYRFTFENRDLVRGVATIDAVLPLGVEIRGNDPIERLQIYALGFRDSRLFSRTEANVEGLREKLKFPVVAQWLDGAPRDLSANEFGELQRWLGTLHRF